MQNVIMLSVVAPFESLRGQGLFRTLSDYGKLSTLNKIVVASEQGAEEEGGVDEGQVSML